MQFFVEEQRIQQQNTAFFCKCKIDNYLFTKDVYMVKVFCSSQSPYRVEEIASLEATSLH